MSIAVVLAALWLLFFTVVIPWRIFVKLRSHRREGRLHSASVHASLGFIYDKYTDESYWHELVCDNYVAVLCGILCGILMQWLMLLRGCRCCSRCASR